MPAVIALPAVVLALVGLLLIYAFRNIIDALVDACLSHLPVIGGRVAGAVKGGLDVANAIAYNLLADYLIPWAHAVLAPVLRFVHFLESLEGLATDTAATLAHIMGTAIPNALRAVRTYAHNLAVGVEHYALKLYHRAVSLAHTAIIAARHYSLALYHGAVRVAHDALHVAVAGLHLAIQAARLAAHTALHAVNVTLSNRITHLATSLNNDVARLERLIAHSAGVSATYVTGQVAKALGQAETYAVHQAGVIATDIDHAASAAVAGVWPDIVAGVKGLEGVIGSDLDDIMAALRRVDLTKPGDLAATIAGLGALALPVLRYLEECGVPNCRNLSKYGRDLQNLLGAIGTASLFGLFIGLATSPESTARDVRDVLVPVMDDARNAANDLIGV